MPEKRKRKHEDTSISFHPLTIEEALKKAMDAGKQFMFADLGETELRGFEDPVRLYELRWRRAG